MILTPLAISFSIFAALLLPAMADEAKPEAKPMPAAGFGSPELLADGSVTFRLKAPKAQEVKVHGQFGPDVALEKGADGVWSATVPKVKAGVWEYNFNVDGMNVVDAMNAMIKPQRNPGTSILHVPSSPPAPWDLRDVPHGVVHQLDYHSKVCGYWRGITVYTPPGALRSDKPLPVLYLSHGYSDNEKSWTMHGKAHWILDNLIAEGEAQPMIVVMPDGHALPPTPNRDKSYMSENTRVYSEDLVSEVVPLIEKTFHVDVSPGKRAFAGLSMGGRHAMAVALNRHAKFQWIGAFSSAPPTEADVAQGLENAAATNADLKLFWIGCGKSDFLFGENEKAHAKLTEKGIKHEYEVTEGDHSWPIWRDYLVKFVPRLFR